MSTLRPLDLERLRHEFKTARPFPFIKIDDFLDPDFAREVAASYPSYEAASKLGKGFESANEHLKVQVTDSAQFPPAVRRLHDALASQEFLDALSFITGIPGLLADESMVGGGMHQTGPRGRLDVHIDFNYLREKQLHRRLNILIYLNPVWDRAWGGSVELWDPEVKVCHQSLEPILNRCVIFETSEISFHGVEAVTCPPNTTRKSFAGYYYTAEAPTSWNGTTHDTVFRARPNERVKGWVVMPLERFGKGWKSSMRTLKQSAKRIIGP
ncbi:MAG TPA: 2OG-Fe(II) oxygenase [Planctomycetota bacterium]|nr:2OG-Fe(II) oxygenase [Planctomycetota bacterium]